MSGFGNTNRRDQPGNPGGGLQRTAEERGPARAGVQGRGMRPQHGPALVNGWFWVVLVRWRSRRNGTAAASATLGTVSCKRSWKWFEGCTGGGGGEREGARLGKMGSTVLAGNQPSHCSGSSWEGPSTARVTSCLQHRPHPQEGMHKEE